MVITYYTDRGIYKGWEHYNKQNYLRYKSWINSGNTIRRSGYIIPLEKLK